MIYHNIEQHTPEWFHLRLGIPTSSEFHRIITPTLKPSTQSRSYLNRLLAEWFTGELVENYESQYMQRGSDLEARAVEAYELITEAETSRGGFITTDSGMIGCSPDRLIGENGDLEIKCPLIHTQIGYALGAVEDDYKAQIQGRLMIHEREWVDVFAYHPQLPLGPVRVHRDEKYIKTLGLMLGTFVDQMLAAREILAARFVVPVHTETKSDDFMSDADIEGYVVDLKKEGKL